MLCTISTDAHRARTACEALNRRLISAAAARRQGVGRGEGARLPAALGQGRRELVTLTERGAGREMPDGRGGRQVVSEAAPVTPLGYTTAVRALPPVLARLDAEDPRRRAAAMIADAAERVGSIKGGDLRGGDISGLPSDGGATTRVKHAARLRVTLALANGWPVDRRSGRITKGAERVALPLGRPSARRHEIRAVPLLAAVCVEGQDMRQILLAHGWSDHGRHRRALADAVLQVLDDVADGFGLGRGGEDNA